MNQPQDPRTPLHVASLRHALVTHGPYERIDHVETTGSTNADLVALAQQGAPAWTALITEHQSQGRGRMGRKYVSPRGAQLTLSVLIRPPHACLKRLGTMPLATGVAVLDALGPAATASLKWPNDVLIEGRKLCGILAEAASLGPQPAVVIGLGLNTALREDELPVPHATSLHLEGIAYERQRLAVDVLTALHRRLRQWESGDPSLMGSYRRGCGTIGQAVRVELPGQAPLTGQAEGISDDGLLVVRDAQGTLHRLAAGDVHHVRPDTSRAKGSR